MIKFSCGVVTTKSLGESPFNFFVPFDQIVCLSGMRVAVQNDQAQTDDAKADVGEGMHQSCEVIVLCQVIAT